MSTPPKIDQSAGPHGTPKPAKAEQGEQKDSRTQIGERGATDVCVMTFPAGTAPTEPGRAAHTPMTHINGEREATEETLLRVEPSY